MTIKKQKKTKKKHLNIFVERSLSRRIILKFVSMVIHKNENEKKMLKFKTLSPLKECFYINFF